MPRKKSTLTGQNPFPILRLPLEIRNRIWRYTLVKDGDVMIRLRGHQKLFKDWVPSRLRSGKEMRWHQEDDERRNGSTPLALALSSRQLYLEATWICDSGNTFNFEKGSYPLIFEDFAAAIGSYNASSITAVRFDAVGPSYIQRLSVLPSLKQLTINGPLRYLVYDRMYYNMNWLPELSTYAKNHPSVVVRAGRLALVQ